MTISEAIEKERPVSNPYRRWLENVAEHCSSDTELPTNSIAMYARGIHPKLGGLSLKRGEELL